MGLRETVVQWHAEGKLDAEHARLRQILEGRRFTREQIAYCFDTMLPGLALLASDPQKNDLTLDALKQKLGKIFADEVRIIEICGELIEAEMKPEKIVLQDIQRAVANQLWQRHSPEEEHDD